MTSGTAKTLRFRHLLTPDGMLHDRQLELDGAGRIAAISPVPDADSAAWDGWLALPGMPNAHSHVFQRALAGFGEARRGEESFWSWREAMYRLAGRMSPDDLHAVARQGFADMLRAGFTSVAEFHYLHHLPDGSRTRAMADAVIAAAVETGIRLRLLPVAYFTSGFGGKPPAEGQKRFVHADIPEYLRLLESLAEVRPGIAPHSLRAVPVEWLGELIAGAESLLGDDFPIHIHIAEQTAELAQCREAHGVTPIRLLLDTVHLDSRWQLVHATHASDDELNDLHETGAGVVICPITEAYLGDGLFPAVKYREQGGRMSIGSDSNCRVDVFEELRIFEYGQRLRDQRRARLADEHGLARLYRETAEAGAAALRMPVGVIREGAFADLVVIPETAPALLGHDANTALDALLINGSRADVADIYVGGVRKLASGAFADSESIARSFDSTVRRLLREN